MSEEKKRKRETYQVALDSCQYESILQKIFDRDILEYHAFRMEVDRINKLYDLIEEITDIIKSKNNETISINNNNFSYYIIPKNISSNELLNYITSKCQQIHKISVKWNDSQLNQSPYQKEITIIHPTIKINDESMLALKTKIFKHLKYN